MGLDPATRDAALDTLQQLVHVCTETEYDGIRQKLDCDIFLPVHQYMVKNWDGIRKECVSRLGDKPALGNDTNNRLESLNQKLKKVIRRNGNLRDFFVDLFTAVSSTRTERAARGQKNCAKVPVHYAVDPGLEQYETLLTPYALQLLSSQLTLSNKVVVPAPDASTPDAVLLDYHGECITVTTTTCPCSVFVQLKLPCRHIFALRKTLGLDTFVAEACATRWQRSYYQDGLRVLCDYKGSVSVEVQ